MDAKLSPQDIKRYNWYIWKFFIGCFVFVVMMIGLTTLGVFGPLPPLRDLENPKSDQATEVISSDKQVLGKWYYTQNRSSVPFRRISSNVTNALVATEDNHFYEHSGIDFKRSFTILLYLMIGKKQGASTITQQLSRNLFSDEERAHNPFKRIIQKMQEQIIAIRIEKHYTKQEILTMYLNTVGFGSNAFGISSAAQTYFNTTPDKLTPEQAAVLIAMLKGPSLYSPVRHPNNSLKRRNFVLSRMAEEGFISDGQAKEAAQKPLGIDYHPVDHNEGLAPYFRSELKKQVQNLLIQHNILKPDGTPYSLERDGLKIYTTIDSRMQRYAEEAQKEYMRDLQNQFNMQWKGVKLSEKISNFSLLIQQGMMHSDRYAELKQRGLSDDEIKTNFYTPDTLNLFTWRGDIDTVMKPIDSVVYCKMLLRNSLMSMDPSTGYIKAWVGGINFEHFKYDQVIKGARQVGSTAKPFTYAVAIKDGFSPCLSVDNIPVTFPDYPGADGKPWTPASSPLETLPGSITLRTALAHSQNWVTAYVMNEVKPEPVVEMIKKMGVTTPVPAVPSICLGVFDATVYDMTGAYSVFANQGIWIQPTFLLRIEDKNGNVLYENVPNKKKAITEETAYVMTDMLKSVVDMQGATGNRLRWKYNFTNPIAGKTGTTQNNSDGWFIGMVPQLVTGLWTGCENRDFHFRSTRMGEGSNSALPIFALYMKKVYADPSLGIKKDIDFTLPKVPLTTTLDCDVYSQQQKGTNPVDKKLSF